MISKLGIFWLLELSVEDSFLISFGSLSPFSLAVSLLSFSVHKRLPDVSFELILNFVLALTGAISILILLNRLSKRSACLSAISALSILKPLLLPSSL